MEFEEWYNSQEKTKEGTISDAIRIHVIKENKNILRLSWNTALLNLPTCESCQHWKLPNDTIKTIGFCHSEHVPLSIFEQGTTKMNKPVTLASHMCDNHSKLEQLRKDEV